MNADMEFLKLAIIEDEEAHFELMQRAIRKDFTQVFIYHFVDAGGFLERMHEIQPDIVLVDYLMPGMDGVEFLRHMQKACIEIPIIMITGQGDERIAVRAMKAGAADYVVKSAEFFGLLPGKIEKAVREQRLKNSLRAMERRFKDLAENASDWIWELDMAGRYIYSNPVVELISGYCADDITGQGLYDVFPEREEEFRKAAVFDLISLGKPVQGFVSRLIHREGREVILETNGVPVFNSVGKVVAFRGIDRDITQRTWAERTLLASHNFLEIANSHMEMGPLLDGFIAEVKKLTACCVAGIRLLDADGNIPYQAYDGISTEVREDPLSIHRCHGMCVDVVSGSGDRNPHLFTEGGSFYTNNAKKFYADYLGQMTGPVCLHCHRLGYQSIALMPIRVGNGITGLIHVADFEENKVPIEIVSLLENVGMILGTAIRRVQMDEALKQSEMRLRSLSSRLLNAQEAERKVIAREIHDSIGSGLSGIKLGLQLNQDKLKKGVLTAESLQYLVSITQRALDDARKIMTDLRPSMLDDLGLVLTINWLCRQLTTICPQIKIEQLIGVEEAGIPEHLKIVIFRVIQESFNNIAKYSKAKKVCVSLVNEDGKIELNIRDNGKGFDLAAVSNRKDYASGLGLNSMRERVDLSRGVFSLQSARNKGTIIHASWPNVS